MVRDFGCVINGCRRVGFVIGRGVGVAEYAIFKPMSCRYCCGEGIPRRRVRHSRGERLAYPSVGAVFALFKRPQYKGLIPPYVVLTKAQGRFSEEGFLGPNFKPFATGGDPNAQRFEVEGVVARGITDARQKNGMYRIPRKLDVESRVHFTFEGQSAVTLARIEARASLYYVFDLRITR